MKSNAFIRKEYAERKNELGFDKEEFLLEILLEMRHELFRKNRPTVHINNLEEYINETRRT